MTQNNTLSIAELNDNTFMVLSNLPQDKDKEPMLLTNSLYVAVDYCYALEEFFDVAPLEAQLDDDHNWGVENGYIL
jgi:hypothetical protein